MPDLGAFQSITRVPSAAALSWSLLALATCVLMVLAARPMADPETAKLLEPFPSAEDGMRRCVINLPKQEDEHSFRVELQVGKTVEVDDRNIYFFAGKLETGTVKGWGYTYVILRTLGPMAGSKMAVLPGAPTVRRFVTLGREPELRRYNSKLPLVVYVPVDVEVKYRIWKAEETAEVAADG